MSIFKKLFLLVAATVACLVAALCGTGYFFISNMGNASTQSHLETLSTVVQNQIDTAITTQGVFADFLQSDPAFALAMAADDKEVLRKTAQELVNRPMVDLVTLTDTEGVVLMRGHSSKLGDKLGARRMSLNIPLQTGERVIGMEPGNVVKLTLASGVPIRHEGKLVGVAIIGMDLTSGEFVNSVKKTMNVECSIFMGDTRESTTVMTNGKPATGTKLNNDGIFQRVMGKGERVITRNAILGAQYDTVYWPWKDMTGKPAGMFFVGLSRATIEAEQMRAILYFILAGLCIGAVMLAVGIFVARAITIPLRESTKFAESVAEGNLDGTLAVKTRDEVGQLSRALATMVQALKIKIAESEDKSREAEDQAVKALQAMEEAATSREKAEAGQEALLLAAGNVEQVVSRLTAAVEHINSQVDTSTRQVSFQHERVTNSATAMEEMNATVLEVAKSAGTAAEGAERSTSKAREGEGIVKESISSISRVQDDTERLSTAMRQLGNQAESIGTVMTVINDIADQTNLLALNAAIEAARAGEAGRGFAVVADEVRKLAEKTMEATKEVSSAISGIQAGARDSIEAVERTGANLGVSTDLVARSGEALKEIVAESEYMADQIRGIATASEQQASTSEEITRSLEEINTSASETASAMQTSAEATAELAAQVRELQDLIMKLRQ